MEFLALEGLVDGDELSTVRIHTVAVIVSQIPQTDSDPNTADSYALGEAHPSA
tara:strand:- start:239 stop:397 length:159 start_codon:yes stop_codon:yes gene_type:complete